MLANIIKKTKQEGSSRGANLIKLRKIYISDHKNRRQTPFMQMYGNSVAYFEDMCAFIIKYCDEKKEKLRPKSFFYGYYDTQLVTTFLLMDYILEWRSSVREISHLFDGVTEDFGERENCFPSLNNSSFFFDKIIEHAKYKSIFEMFLLRCLFDLDVLLKNEYYLYSWTDGWERRYIYPPKYMRNLETYISYGKVKINKELEPLYNQVQSKYLEFENKVGSFTEFDYTINSDIRSILMKY